MEGEEKAKRDERRMGWKKQESDDKKYGKIERNETYGRRDRILD